MARHRATIADIEEFVRLQRELARALVDAFHLSGDIEFGWPSKGDLLLEEQAWRFTRHGKVYRFECERGERSTTVVDFADGMPGEWARFDAWRLTIYLGSIRVVAPVANADDTPLSEAIAQWLEDETAAGRLVRVGQRRFRLP